MTDKPKQREVVVQPLAKPAFNPKILNIYFPDESDTFIVEPCTMAWIHTIKNIKTYMLLNRIKHDELKTRIQWVIEQTGITPTDTEEELEKKLEDAGLYSRTAHATIMDCAVKKPIEYFIPSKLVEKDIQ